jgi:hypothetical protein
VNDSYQILALGGGRTADQVRPLQDRVVQLARGGESAAAEACSTASASCGRSGVCRYTDSGKYAANIARGRDSSLERLENPP